MKTPRQHTQAKTKEAFMTQPSPATPSPQKNHPGRWIRRGVLTVLLVYLCIAVLP